MDFSAGQISTGRVGTDLGPALEEVIEFLGQAYVRARGEIARLELVCDDYRESCRFIQRRPEPTEPADSPDDAPPDTAQPETGDAPAEESSIPQPAEDEEAPPASLAPNPVVDAILAQARQIRSSEAKKTKGLPGTRRSSTQLSSARLSSSRAPSGAGSSASAAPRLWSARGPTGAAAAGASAATAAGHKPVTRKPPSSAGTHRREPDQQEPKGSSGAEAKTGQRSRPAGAGSGGAGSREAPPRPHSSRGSRAPPVSVGTTPITSTPNPTPTEHPNPAAASRPPKPRRLPATFRDLLAHYHSRPHPPGCEARSEPLPARPNPAAPPPMPPEGPLGGDAELQFLAELSALPEGSRPEAEAGPGPGPGEGSAPPAGGEAPQSHLRGALLGFTHAQMGILKVLREAELWADVKQAATLPAARLCSCSTVLTAAVRLHKEVQAALPAVAPAGPSALTWRNRCLRLLLSNRRAASATSASASSAPATAGPQGASGPAAGPEAPVTRCLFPPAEAPDASSSAALLQPLLRSCDWLPPQCSKHTDLWLTQTEQQHGPVAGGGSIPPRGLSIVYQHPSELTRMAELLHDIQIKALDCQLLAGAGEPLLWGRLFKEGRYAGAATALTLKDAAPSAMQLVAECRLAHGIFVGTLRQRQFFSVAARADAGPGRVGPRPGSSSSEEEPDDEAQRRKLEERQASWSAKLRRSSQGGGLDSPLGRRSPPRRRSLV